MRGLTDAERWVLEHAVPGGPPSDLAEWMRPGVREACLSVLRRGLVSELRPRNRFGPRVMGINDAGREALRLDLAARGGTP